MSISDNIRKAALDKATEAAPQGNQTQAAAEQLAVQATGKGISGSQSQLSNVSERLAMSQGKAQQQAIAEQQFEEADRLTNAETQQIAEQQAVQQSLRIKEMQQNAQLADQLDEMLSNVKASDMALEDREDQMELEHLGRQLRMSNEQYLHDLDMAKQREQLNDRAAYARKARELNMSEGLKNAMDKLDKNKALNSMQIQADLEAALSDIANATELLESNYRDLSGNQNMMSALSFITQFGVEYGKSEIKNAGKGSTDNSNSSKNALDGARDTGSIG